MKTHIYKVYDQSGNYVKTWSDVITDFGLPEEINTPGSEIKVGLARPVTNTGIGTDVVLDYQVKIYAVDDDTAAQNGLLVFHGYILEFAPSYGKTEGLDITLSSYGLDLGEHLLDLGDPVINNLWLTNIDLGSTGFNTNLAQTFTPDHDLYCQSVRLWVKTTNDGSGGTRWPVGVSIIQGDPNGVTPESGTPLATVTQYVDTDTEWQQIDFMLDDVIQLTSGTQYYIELGGSSVSASYINIYLQATDNSNYSDGNLYLSNAGAAYSNTSYTSYDLRFSINGGTTLTQNSVDPSDMLRLALDIYQAQGGQISYTGGSIDSTGYVASYQFNGLTMLEVIKKCVELAPPDWYFYVDQANNVLHFHQKTSTIHHKFVLGKNISELKPQVTKRNVVNTVYFVGGGGLYRKYTRGSGATRAIRYVDQRVTTSATADLIAETLLEAKNAPEVRVTVKVLDNNGSSNTGYDIESITVGENLAFRGIEASSTSIWDVAIWDTSYWDFNPSEIETLVLQIVRIEREPGSATIKLTSLPQDVNKRIEDINRRIVQDQTVDLGATAEVVIE